MAQLSRRREAAILDGDNDGMLGVERGADLAGVGIAQPGGRRTAPDEDAIGHAEGVVSGSGGRSPRRRNDRSECIRLRSSCSITGGQAQRLAACSSRLPYQAPS